MLKFTSHNLKKLETLFEELAYAVRYEKGNFQAGYCILQDRKIVIINRFYETEGRINCLLEILSDIQVKVEQLSEKSAKFYKDIQQGAFQAPHDKQTP